MRLLFFFFLSLLSPNYVTRSSREMIDFFALHNIKPQIELMPIDKINEALDLVRKNKPRYRIVLTHPNN